MKLRHFMWLMCLMAFGHIAGWAADGVKITITYNEGTVKVDQPKNSKKAKVFISNNSIYSFLLQYNAVVPVLP